MRAPEPHSIKRLMKIYFMRHGQTNYNVRGLCNDDPRSPVHLTALGEQQAGAAAERLKNARLDRIVVSELPRTRETAAIINRHHGVPVVARPAINDIRSGFNDRPVAEYMAAIAHDPLRARVNGGESLLDHKARVLGFLDWLRTQPDRAVLVIAHEETLRVIAARFRGLTDDAMRALAFANGEIIEFDL